MVGAHVQAGGVSVQPHLERLPVQRGEGERQPAGHTATASPVAGALARVPGRAGSLPASNAARSPAAAASAAASFRTWSSRSRVSYSVPVRIARRQPRVISVISEAKCPVLRANR